MTANEGRAGNERTKARNKKKKNGATTGNSRGKKKGDLNSISMGKRHKQKQKARKFTKGTKKGAHSFSLHGTRIG